MQHPILRDIPDVLETERLILRCPLPGDGLLVNNGMRESWAELSQWMAWASGDPPPAEETEILQRQGQADYLQRSGFHFTMLLKADQTFAAKISLFRMDWDVPSGEIGYWLRTGLVGQGLMTEGAEAVTRFGLETLGLARVEIRCDPLNRRSAAIPERLGYRKEGHLVNNARTAQGELRDTLIYAITPTDTAIRSLGSLGH